MKVSVFEVETREKGVILESELLIWQIAVTQLPVLLICVVQKSAKKYDFQTYECPVYMRKNRGIKSRVFAAELKTEELPTRWILRGVALLCSDE